MCYAKLNSDEKLGNYSKNEQPDRKQEVCQSQKLLG